MAPKFDELLNTRTYEAIRTKLVMQNEFKVMKASLQIHNNESCKNAFKAFS